MTESQLEQYDVYDIIDFILSEDFDQLNELDKKTLASYTKKAIDKAADNVGHYIAKDHGAGGWAKTDATKRIKGVKTAFKKLGDKGYGKKATDDAMKNVAMAVKNDTGDKYHKAHMAGIGVGSDRSFEQIAKNRIKGIKKAADKLAKENYDVESMLEYADYLDSQLDEMKFPGVDAGRVTKYSAVVSHNGVLGSHAVIFHHNDETGEKTEHDRMGSSAKGHEKAIYANIKKKYGNVMFEGAEMEDETIEIQSEDIKTTIKSMLESIVAGELVESKDSFSNILFDKIAAKLDEAKLAVAQGIFGESKDDDEDDEKSDETSDEDFAKHPLNQLQKIADYKPNTEEEDTELTKIGTVDLRAKRAKEARLAKKGSTSGKPQFHHKNGEKSDIEPEHAQHIVNVLKGSSVKPDTKKAVLDTIHGSKAGLDKIKTALGTGVVKSKSIYGDDVRA